MGGKESKPAHHTNTTTTTTNNSNTLVGGGKMPNLKGESLLLNEEHVRHLARYLPNDEYRQDWSLLFSSKLNGHSFNRFCHHTTEKGSTLIIIKETGGNIFGAFADEAWKTRYPKFYGNDHNFLFQIIPELKVFQCTGLDKNYQYLNEGSKTLFNGIGMGGIEELFGWCIDESFEHGYSRGSTEILENGDGKERSSTYGNTNLGSTQEFHIEYVESWLLKPLVLTEEQLLEIEYNNRKKSNKPSGSVLKSEGNADKAIKGMMGHEFSVFDEDLHPEANKRKLADPNPAEHHR